MIPSARWVALDDDACIAGFGEGDPPPGALHLGGARLAPGFVDLQVNGIGDVDFATAPAEAIARGLRALAAAGTTACLPTLVSAPLDAYGPAIERILTAAAGGGRGRASVLGVHLEGPFLGAAPGAHQPKWIRPADVGWMRGLIERFPGVVRLVTLAPEADPGQRLTRLLVEHGIVVAIGHTGVGHAEAVAAADAGASMVTHLFNAMSGLHHRQPGVVGAALTDPRLVPSLIADFVHVHPAAVRVAVAARPDLVLVSDAVAVEAGTVGGISVRAADGAARTPDGVLAGAVLPLAGAVANLVGIGVPAARALAMASAGPAELIGAHGHGRLEVGARADLIALDDTTLALRAVWVGGEPILDR